MKKITLILIIFTVLIVTAQMSTILFQKTPAIDQNALRKITQGVLVGFTGAFDTQVWMGVPYAEPPVKKLRWRATKALEPWEGVREALVAQQYCTQLGNVSVTLNPLKWGKVAGSEDCLYLNIWAPRFELDNVPNEGEQLPVMVWIHGGGNTMGQAATYDLAKLAGTQQVLAVSINYRLGVFGWFSYPSLRATASNDLDRSSNFAVLDMIESLKWVKNNIAAFGGNPANVTIFGESAGGKDVLALMASPLAKDLFHRAIVQSGVTHTITTQYAENYRDDVIPGHSRSSSEVLMALLINDKKAADRPSAKKAIAALTDQQIVTYLRSKKADEIIPLFDDVSMGMYDTPQMIRDGIVFRDIPFVELFKQPGRFNSVPVITGVNRDELKLFLMGQDEFVNTTWGVVKEVRNPARYELFNRYRSDLWRVAAVDEVASALTQSQSPVWAYQFNWDEGGNSWLGDMSQVFGAAHSLEIPFVLGQFEGLSYPGIFTQSNKVGRDLLSDQMMSYWANFAYSGIPGKGREHIQLNWEPWGEQQQFIVFDTPNDTGVTMDSGASSYAEIKRRLVADTTIDNIVDRCRLYVQMFYRHSQWDEKQYQRMGCEAYSPSRFSIW